MTPKEMKDRTKRVAVTATSTAANYRACCRARSRAEFIAKLGTVLEEADESLFWLELMVDAELITKTRAEKLMKDADELTAIFVTSLKTAKHQISRSKIRD